MNPFFKLIRPLNILMVIATQLLMIKAVIIPITHARGLTETSSPWILFMTIASTALITMGGYIINDYFDTRIDEINRPSRVIVGKRILRTKVMLAHQITTYSGVILGLIVSWYIQSITTAMIHVFVPGLLWFYSSAYKRQFLIGNIVVAFTSALVPVLITLVYNQLLLKSYGADIMKYGITADIYLWIGFFTVFTFFISILREITKDIEDEHGDRELECSTLPIVLGIKWTKVILISLSGTLIAAVMYLIYSIGIFEGFAKDYLIYGLCGGLIFYSILITYAKQTSDYTIAQRVLKIIMCIGLLFSIVFKYSM